MILETGAPRGAPVSRIIHAEPSYNDLPLEVIEMIFLHLQDRKDIAHLARTSRRFNSVVGAVLVRLSFTKSVNALFSSVVQHGRFNEMLLPKASDTKFPISLNICHNPNALSSLQGAMERLPRLENLTLSLLEVSASDALAIASTESKNLKSLTISGPISSNFLNIFLAKNPSIEELDISRCECHVPFASATLRTLCMKLHYDSKLYKEIFESCPKLTRIWVRDSDILEFLSPSSIPDQLKSIYREKWARIEVGDRGKEPNVPFHLKDPLKKLKKEWPAYIEKLRAQPIFEELAVFEISDKNFLLYLNESLRPCLAEPLIQVTSTPSKIQRVFNWVRSFFE